MCLLKDKEKVETVLKFTPYSYSSMFNNPSLFSFEPHIFTSPILLSFLCILAKDSHLDLEKKGRNWEGSGKVYFRICQCMYRKYTERKRIPYVQETFLSLMTRIGKLAWEMLCSSDNWFQKSHVIEIVGGDAFDYSFLIGHEDDRLFGDETSDVYITFPHRSIQEFFGAFYSIKSLNNGRSITKLIHVDDKFSPVLINPLFLEFCLWFVKQKDIFFPGVTDAYETMKSYVSERVNYAQLDLSLVRKTYPALNFLFAEPEISRDVAKFFKDVLGSSNKIKQLILNNLSDAKEVDAILTLMLPLLENLSSITVQHFLNPLPLLNTNIFKTNILCSKNELSINLWDVKITFI